MGASNTPPEHGHFDETFGRRSPNSSTLSFSPCAGCVRGGGGTCVLHQGWSPDQVKTIGHLVLSLDFSPLSFPSLPLSLVHPRPLGLPMHLWKFERLADERMATRGRKWMSTLPGQMQLPESVMVGFPASALMVSSAI
jgi:hypothetical protein